MNDQLKLLLLLLTLHCSLPNVYAQSSGKALDFTGNDYIAIPTAPAFSFGSTDDFSLEAWVTNRGTNSGHHDRIVARGLDATDSWQIAITNTDNELWFGDGPAEKVVSAVIPQIRDGNWHFVSLTHSGTTTRLYFDGLLVGENTADSRTYTGGNEVLIGAYPGVVSFGTINEWNGNIDEVRIWNRVLTQAEVRKLMCQRLSGSEPGLVAYYRMDEGVDNSCSGGEDVCDASGNGNHGTKF